MVPCESDDRLNTDIENREGKFHATCFSEHDINSPAFSHRRFDEESVSNGLITILTLTWVTANKLNKYFQQAARHVSTCVCHVATGSIIFHVTKQMPVILQTIRSLSWGTRFSSVRCAFDILRDELFRRTFRRYSQRETKMFNLHLRTFDPLTPREMIDFFFF